MLIQTHQHGFSLLETVIVLSILSCLILLEIPTSLSSYLNLLQQSDLQLFVSALTEARAQALFDVCKNPKCTAPPAHGIFFTSTQLVIFEGASYAGRYGSADIALTFSTPETISASSSEIVFAAGTGNTASNQSIYFLRTNQRTHTIPINTDGIISP
jgi:prepilin-type N-terminal cleavage/methylation domain-containing protein